MVIVLISISIILLTIISGGLLIFQWTKAKPEPLAPLVYVKLIISGVIAFIADTFGVGSFAVNVMMARLLNTFQDDELPAMNNGAQVIPGAIESFYFMQAITVDLTTLVTLIAGTCLGGLVGGAIVSRLRQQALRIAMICCFAFLLSLLIANQLQLLPIGGDKTSLNGGALILGFFALSICGALTSVGIGLFAMVQGVLFLMHVSPLVAFPIMMCAGAMQQPLTTMVFLQKKKIPLKRTLILSLGGCIGAVFALSMFKYVSASNLHWVLAGIVLYNLLSMIRAYFTARPQQFKAIGESLG